MSLCVLIRHRSNKRIGRRSLDLLFTTNKKISRRIVAQAFKIGAVAYLVALLIPAVMQYRSESCQPLTKKRR